MAPLTQSIIRSRAKSTHHKMALDALGILKRHDAHDWQAIFLNEVDAYFRGAKAPDDEFKDFKNHVLHVAENNWGGAPKQAGAWYDKLVASIRGKQWTEAAFQAGVLSHYVTDPIQPFHTGQSERESTIHRASEWSITKSYDELRDILKNELGGYPTTEFTREKDWLSSALIDVARVAHREYEFLIDHYNFEIGSKRPELGFDEPAKRKIATLIGLATTFFAGVLERAIEEAGSFPPQASLSMAALSEALWLPISMAQKLSYETREQSVVDAMFVEYQMTGKSLKTLPEDDRAIRTLHAQEVRKISLDELDREKPGPIGAAYVGPFSPKGTRFLPIQPSRVESGESSAGKMFRDFAAADRPSLAQSSEDAPINEVRVTKASFDKPNTPATEPQTASSDLYPTRPALPHKNRAAIPNQETQPSLLKPRLAISQEIREEKMTASNLETPRPQPVDRSATADDQALSRSRPAEPLSPKPSALTSTDQPASLRKAVPEKLTSPRYYLYEDAPVVDAPSIGPKMASRLNSIGIQSVGDLLTCPVESFVKLLGKGTGAQLARDWKDQARLMCDVPGLRGHDAQLLVGAEIREASELEKANPAEVLKKVLAFADSTRGERILRGSNPPDEAEVRDWVTQTKERTRKAA